MIESEFEAQLTLKDKLNFPYLLANQILTFQRSILNLEFSEREIKESIAGFVHLIPENWKDEDWGKEIKAAKIIQEVDVRKEWCGLKIGKPIIEKHESFDYYKMFQACINLLERRGMISKVIMTDKFTGQKYDK